MARSTFSRDDLERAVILGRFILARRQEAGLSRSALARRSDISNEMVKKIEDGRGPGTSFQIVGRLSSTLNFSLDVLLSSLRAVSGK